MMSENKTSYQKTLDQLLMDARAAIVSRATYEWEQGGKDGVLKITPTVEEAQVVQEIEALIAACDDELSHAFDEKIIRVGAHVKVIAGVKIPLGTVGRVFWIGESIAHPEWGTRVGIKVDDDDNQVEWTSINNVEVDL